MDPLDVAPLRFGPAVSPHLAAELAGATIDSRALMAGAERLAEPRSEGLRPVLCVEGAGGLLVPLSAQYLMRDLARDIGLPVLIAARPGLGTISHTLLTLEAARGSGLKVAAVVLTPWPTQPDEIEVSNRETIAELGSVEVATLGEVTEPAPAELADAGAGLPWRKWLEMCSPPLRD
jgi:dethiobiotin synthetase